jgi:hypothetical protein
MSRPYWVTLGRGWSFGFVIQKRNLLEKMFILNFEDLPKTYRNDELRSVRKSIEEVEAAHMGVGNLGVYFGAILIHHYKWGYRDLFFHLKRHLFWNNSRNVDQQFINLEVTKDFCGKYGVKAFPIASNAATRRFALGATDDGSPRFSLHTK